MSDDAKAGRGIRDGVGTRVPSEGIEAGDVDGFAEAEVDPGPTTGDYSETDDGGFTAKPAGSGSPPDTTVPDEHYNLVWVLEASLNNAWRLATYIEDARIAGDDELAEWFSKIQHNNVKAGEQGKKLLSDRLARQTAGSVGT